MVAKAIRATIANDTFLFFENINRPFEFVIGLITIALVASIMDLGRK